VARDGRRIIAEGSSSNVVDAVFDSAVVVEIQSRIIVVGVQYLDHPTAVVSRLQ
jgi:hypothetical protein